MVVPSIVTVAPSISTSVAGQGGVRVSSQSSSLSPYDIHQRLFGYKRGSGGKGKTSKKHKKADIPWTHTFVCLAEKQEDYVPTDYSMLTANGLGKSKLHLFENSSAMDIHNAIINQFPKLVHCGGYDLLRTIENTKRLNVLTPPPEGYTGQFLKKVLGQANCYIRPLQRDILLQESPAATSGVQVSDLISMR